MKDLKHLIYFENLLQEANNELVQQAKAEGEHALGYTCYSSAASRAVMTISTRYSRPRRAR